MRKSFIITIKSVNRETEKSCTKGDLGGILINIGTDMIENSAMRGETRDDEENRYSWEVTGKSTNDWMWD